MVLNSFSSPLSLNDLFIKINLSFPFKEENNALKNPTTENCLQGPPSPAWKKENQYDPSAWFPRLPFSSLRFPCSLLCHSSPFLSLILGFSLARSFLLFFPPAFYLCDSELYRQLHGEAIPGFRSVSETALGEYCLRHLIASAFRPIPFSPDFSVWACSCPLFLFHA